MTHELTPSEIRTQLDNARLRVATAEEALRGFCGATSFGSPHAFTPGGWQVPDEDGYVDYETCDKPADHADHREYERIRRAERWDRFIALVDEYGGLSYPLDSEEERRRELEHTAAGRTELERLEERAREVAVRIADEVIGLGLHVRPEGV